MRLKRSLCRAKTFFPLNFGSAPPAARQLLLVSVNDDVNGGRVMLGRTIKRSAVTTLITATLLLGSVAPVLAQDRCRNRNYQVSRYERDRSYDSRYYDDYR